MKAILLTVRLIILMLLGAFIGLYITPDLVAQYHGYDHGFGESQRTALVAVPTCALLGLAVEGLLRLLKNDSSIG